MIPSNKEKWVINRLKRQGYKNDFHDYSDEEMLLYKSILPYKNGYDSVDCLAFHISRKMGCYIHFRPSKNPALHLKYHFSWPRVKNWHEIEAIEKFIISGFGIDNLPRQF